MTVHYRPDTQGVAIDLPALRERPQQPVVFDPGRGHPGVYAVLDPDGDGHGADAPAFAFEVSQDPPALSLLNGRDVELGQLVPPQGATDQKGQDDIVALPFQGRGRQGLLLRRYPRSGWVMLCHAPSISFASTHACLRLRRVCAE
jgi:hypothetical protein